MQKRALSPELKAIAGLEYILGLLLFSSMISAAFAQPTSANSISFQGALNGTDGKPLADGNYNLIYRFYDSLAGGVPVAVTNVSGVTVGGGIASTAIPVEAAWFNGRTRYLGTGVNGGQELSPRVPMTAVPYALSADSVSNKAFWSPNGYVSDFVTNFVDTFNVQGRASVTDAIFVGSARNGENHGLVLRGPALPTDSGSAQELQWAFENGGRIKLKGYRGADYSTYLAFLTTHATGEERVRMLMDSEGNVGIGTVNPVARLDVNGTTRTKILQITGGADLAEHLNVTDANPRDEFKVEPGMVVSIDSSANRMFKLSDESYDRKRVGIISGGNGVQPGLILRDEGNPQADGEQPIALTGQVWCHADASFGAITPGDLITTSTTPGHAMKVSDDAKARFAVLGQALTGLKKGRGWVQVLVGKQ